MEKPQPIIRVLTAYEDYPFEAIDINVIARLEHAAHSLAPSYKSKFPSFLKILECFLQITSQHLSEESLCNPHLVQIYRTFVGAIVSDHLIDRPGAWKATRIKMLNTLLDSVLPTNDFKATFPFVTYSPANLTQPIQDCIQEFLDLTFHENKTWLWRGWITQSRAGNLITLPFYPIYKKLGRKFTDELFNACDIYFRGKRYRGLAGLTELSRFLGQYPKGLSPYHLRIPRFTATFWTDFFEFYMVSRYADSKGPPVSTLISEWRKQVVNLVKNALEPSGLFAKPLGPFPLPPPKYVEGSRTNIRTNLDGHEVKVKLITAVPLYVTDDEAMRLLFNKIEEEVDIFVRWAEWAIADLWERYQRRIRLAQEGTVRELHRVGEQYGDRRQITSRDNPNYLQNAAATFHRYGHSVRERQNNIFYPRPLSQTATELGLPVTDALFPHCILLVAEHPEITPAFLENCELFDRNGKLVGLVHTDGGAQLVSAKHRRGSQNAQQTVLLSKRTQAVVEQIVAITKSARDFLQAEENDDWRYLLITCKRGFGYPTRIRQLFTATSKKDRIDTFAKCLGNTCALPLDERIDLVRRFSLVALRASVGVLVYIRTNSVDAMAKSLGHASYSHRLISSYLPEPIASFFRERWIRIFQTGIIVMALEGSQHLLPASGFKSMAELDQFLHNHALKVPPPECRPAQHNDNQNSEANVEKRVAIGLNTEILAVLISLQLAVEQSSKEVSATARYWSEITNRIVAFLESDLNTRPDLRRCLSKARLQVFPSLMEGLIYV